MCNYPQNIFVDVITFKKLLKKEEINNLAFLMIFFKSTKELTNQRLSILFGKS